MPPTQPRGHTGSPTGGDPGPRGHPGATAATGDPGDQRQGRTRLKQLLYAWTSPGARPAGHGHGRPERATWWLSLPLRQCLGIPTWSHRVLSCGVACVRRPLSGIKTIKRVRNKATWRNAHGNRLNREESRRCSPTTRRIPGRTQGRAWPQRVLRLSGPCVCLWGHPPGWSRCSDPEGGERERRNADVLHGHMDTWTRAVTCQEATS